LPKIFNAVTRSKPNATNPISKPMGPSRTASKAQSQPPSSPPLRPARTSSRNLIDGEKKAALEEYFQKDANPSMEARKKLAQKIHIDAHRVSQWFAMRRFRLRRASEESNKSTESQSCGPDHTVDPPRDVIAETPQHEEPAMPTIRTIIIPPNLPPAMSLRSKSCKEPSSTSSIEAPPLKRTRFIAPTPVKSRSSHGRHAPRTFFPPPDWDAPPASEKTPVFTFWFAKPDSELPAATTKVVPGGETASVSASSPGPTDPSHVSRTMLAIPANTSKSLATAQISGISPNPSTFSQTISHANNEVLPAPNPMTYPTELQAHIDRALQANTGRISLPASSSKPPTRTVSNRQVTHHPSAHSHPATTFVHHYFNDPAPQVTAVVVKGASHVHHRNSHYASNHLMHAMPPSTTDTPIGPTNGSYHHGYHTSAHSYHDSTHSQHHSVALASSAIPPQATDYWSCPKNVSLHAHSVPQTSRPTLPSLAHPSSSSAVPGFTSHALHNSLVTTAMSKLDTIATIARMRISEEQRTRR